MILPVSGISKTRSRLHRQTLAVLAQTLILGGLATPARSQDHSSPPQVVVSACRMSQAGPAVYGNLPRATPDMRKGADFVRTANVHAQAGDYERAWPLFDRAIGVNPANPSFYLSRGSALMAVGEFDRAVQDFDKAIALDRSSSAAFFARGQSHVRMNRHALGIEDLDEAIKLLPGNAAAHTIRGTAYTAMRDYTRAIDGIGQAIELDPKCSYGFIQRGVAHDLRGDRESAMADYARALELIANPTSAIAFGYRGFVYSSRREYGPAIQDFAEAFKRDSKNAGRLNSLCYVRAIAGAIDDALADCNAALQIRPSDPFILDSRAFTYLRKGALDEAIAGYDDALRINPRSPQSLYGRGVAKRQKGNITGGLADIEAAQAIRPSVADEMALLGIK